MRALITGQAALLLATGHDGFGFVRRSSTESFKRIAHIDGRVTLLQSALLQASLEPALTTAAPHEIHNLGARRASFPNGGCSPC